MCNVKFIHLNVHSDYSLKDGLCKLSSLLQVVKKYNVPSLAITDDFNISCLVKFFNMFYKIGVKPIIGIDALFIHENDPENLFSIVILVMNDIGYNNLIQLITLSHKMSYLNKNKLLLYQQWIIEYCQGLIFLFDIHNYFMQQKEYVIEKLFFWKKKLNNCLYLQIYRIGIENEYKYIQYLLHISSYTNIPLVATNKVLFLSKKDFYFNKIRTAIYYRCLLKQVDPYITYTRHQYFKTEREMLGIFQDMPEVLVNSVEIAKRCNFILKYKGVFLPKYRIPINKQNITDASEYLIYVSYKALEQKILSNIIDVSKKYIYMKRLKYELSIINSMKYFDYFLIVMEFVVWAKNNNIAVGPGRGSGSGSLVAYVLYITDIDPIKYGLFFERFLNPERVSLPDLDIDFCMLKRDQVIEHIEKTYGVDSVAQIVVFNKLTAKSVIREVGRVLGYSYIFVDKIVRLIPLYVNKTLYDILSNVPNISYLYSSNIECKILIDISFVLEGVIKSIGRHAGGVIISPTLITDFCPIYKDVDNNKILTQFDKIDIEYVGLIKFDLLGLRTLTVINKCVKLIQKRYPSINFNLNNIDFKDKKSFCLLNKANTTSIFQLESYGMRNLIKRLLPKNFEEIVAIIALFRPGPLQTGMVDNFIDRKYGREKICYPDSKWQHILLKPILQSTYGIILYQEQVMLIARVLANYSLGYADMLRRAMGKKDIVEMKKHRSIFVNKAKKKNIDVLLAEKIFSLMEYFASYGFNKSHSVSYAYTAYQTLWLKANFPMEFLISVINTDIDNLEKIQLSLNELKWNNFIILPPNINKSLYYFSINNENKIVYGLGAIKGIGKKIINFIINIRNKCIFFKNFFHFCYLTLSKLVTKMIIKNFIYSGTFDIFNMDRSFLIYIRHKIINLAQYKKQLLSNRQLTLFNMDIYLKNLEKKLIIDSLKNFSPLSMIEQLLWEKTVLGNYITNHPINLYQDLIHNFLCKTHTKIVNIKSLFINNFCDIINIIGVIVSVKIYITKNNNKICYAYVDDSTSEIKICLYKDLYRKYISLLRVNTILLVNGFINNQDVKYNYVIIVNYIKNLINY